MAGRVRVDGVPADKAGTSVEGSARIELAPAREFVSRAGHKLANALDALGVDVEGEDALDVGASTGGFTDCLLARGARRVVCVDVGYGQLDWALRNDPRVTVLERTNARRLTPDQLPFAPTLATVDVSFIGARRVWPAVRRCMASSWRALIMVKPQFELEPGDVASGGVVRDPALRADAVRRVVSAVRESGSVAGVVDSGLPGPKGNRELFVLAGSGPGLDEEAIEAAIRAAVELKEAA
jgi:23S rRNA (cytidine1920-2'-O)/16S rRNA (cytidine1409-2'-O)-methyltransferase